MIFCKQNINKKTGTSISSLDWKVTPYLTLYQQDGTILEIPNVPLGVLQENANESPYVGLIVNDDNRPTFLQQISLCRSFRINFQNDTLELFLNTKQQKRRRKSSTTSSTTTANDKSRISTSDPYGLQLIDLKRYGRNLWHYAVSCTKLVFSTTTLNSSSTNDSNLVVTQDSLDRKLCVVLDTGLTGRIFSDSLTNELAVKYPNVDWSMTKQPNNNDNVSTITDLTVHLPYAGSSSNTKNKRNIPTSNSVFKKQLQQTSNNDSNNNNDDEMKNLILKSRKEYFYISSFKLPWFDNDDTHPHIVAIGTTFWTNTNSLTIDLNSMRVKIDV